MIRRVRSVVAVAAALVLLALAGWYGKAVSAYYQETIVIAYREARETVTELVEKGKAFLEKELPITVTTQKEKKHA